MVDKQVILESVGPVQAILDAHDGVVNVLDTTDGVIMISLEGGCTGSSTPNDCDANILFTNEVGRSK